MRVKLLVLILGAGMIACPLALDAVLAQDSPPLGLPEVPVPPDNPMTQEKIDLGDKLFHDDRFSTTGDVSCSTCHLEDKAFTDGPLQVSEGIEGLTGTRNAPTIINSAYMTSLFHDGRSPSLEDQALHPFVNPVEMGLDNHDPILEIVRTDPEYVEAFEEVFNADPDEITIDHITKAIAAFERTIISGNSPFDRYFYGGETDAMTEAQIRGLDLFQNKGRCVSCHLIEESTATFTDGRFHNVGVGINDLIPEVPDIAKEFVAAARSSEEVDEEVLSDPRSSEMGRLAVTGDFDGIGAFKTPTIRNVAVTAPYMHDGSLPTLRDVMVHYNNGGVTVEGNPVNDFLSDGIRPLNLTDEEIDDLVAFMEALTSPEFEHLVGSEVYGGAQ